ncbi:MAG: flagellar basal body rod protein FlgC [Verrucomicrobia bacterium]|jgi:flagellar basal-body rod protein FlgC|nr:flagellar basal body rod protein FlgC [Verrucomicrobiota bacterium]
MLNLLTGATSTVAALNAERLRLEVITQNIANANTTRGLDGKPYQRQQVAFESALRGAFANPNEVEGNGPTVREVKPDTRAGRTVYQPGHPHANADGMLQLPNVNIHEEMADMIVASRTFEANLAVIKNSRQLATLTMSIGKR